jgi:hypothetical protein
MSNHFLDHSAKQRFQTQVATKKKYLPNPTAIRGYAPQRRMLVVAKGAFRDLLSQLFDALGFFHLPLLEHMQKSAALTLETMRSDPQIPEHHYKAVGDFALGKDLSSAGPSTEETISTFRWIGVYNVPSHLPC